MNEIIPSPKDSGAVDDTFMYSAWTRHTVHITVAYSGYSEYSPYSGHTAVFICGSGGSRSGSHLILCVDTFCRIHLSPLVSEHTVYLSTTLE